MPRTRAFTASSASRGFAFRGSAIAFIEIAPLKADHGGTEKKFLNCGVLRLVSFPRQLGPRQRRAAVLLAVDGF
jgi:hypothetical protein